MATSKVGGKVGFLSSPTWELQRRTHGNIFSTNKMQGLKGSSCSCSLCNLHAFCPGNRKSRPSEPSPPSDSLSSVTVHRGRKHGHKVKVRKDLDSFCKVRSLGLGAGEGAREKNEEELAD